MFKWLLITCGFLTSSFANATEWKTTYHSFGESTHQATARSKARQFGNKKVGPLYQLCRKFSGSPAHYNRDVECWLYGSDGYLCAASTTVKCQLGTFKQATELQKLEGVYLDEQSGGFVHIDENKKLSFNIMAPYFGGRDLREVTPLSRTGENTYTMQGRFVSAHGCGNVATFDFSKLKDGTLLVSASSPERVTSIIFGACHWTGTVRSFYELKKIEFE